MLALIGGGGHCIYCLQRPSPVYIVPNASDSPAFTVQSVRLDVYMAMGTVRSPGCVKSEEIPSYGSIPWNVQHRLLAWAGDLCPPPREG